MLPFLVSRSVIVIMITKGGILSFFIWIIRNIKKYLIFQTGYRCKNTSLTSVSTSLWKALQTRRTLLCLGGSAWFQVLEQVERFILERTPPHPTPAVRLVLLITAQAPSQCADLLSYPWVLAQFPYCQQGVRSYSVLVCAGSFFPLQRLNNTGKLVCLWGWSQWLHSGVSNMEHRALSLGLY